MKIYETRDNVIINLSQVEVVGSLHTVDHSLTVGGDKLQEFKIHMTSGKSIGLLAEDYNPFLEKLRTA